MDVIYERCCGVDIHQQSVVACVIVPGAAGTRPQAAGGGRASTPLAPRDLI